VACACTCLEIPKVPYVVFIVTNIPLWEYYNYMSLGRSKDDPVTHLRQHQTFLMSVGATVQVYHDLHAVLIQASC
jgi:hypothetical protein